jgi:predicted amidohydrolase
MKTALIQMQMAPDAKTNLVKSLTYLEQAAGMGADLVLYPEIQLSQFFPQFPGNIGGCCGGGLGPKPLTMEDGILQMFCELCRKYHVMASANFYFMENGKAYDTSFLIGRDGRVIGRQKMVHIAQAPQFYEQDYYTPSDDGFHVFEADGCRTGIVVCFDRHYPESIRTEALRGAQLILIPTANTKAEPMELFMQEIRVQAYQNCCYIVMCNRVGREAAMEFAGESLAVGPDGEVIAKAGSGEEILMAEIDPAMADAVRAKRPYLNLRRPDLYE